MTEKSGTLVKEFIDKVVEEMERQQISQSELARRMGVSPSAVSHMLSGQRNLRIKTCINTVTALGCQLVLTVEEPETIPAVQKFVKSLG